jgi:Uma2 family endonuclease
MKHPTQIAMKGARSGFGCGSRAACRVPRELPCVQPASEAEHRRWACASACATLSAFPMVQNQPRVTVDEYLAAEASSQEKHEYLRGIVFAMSGGTPEHARITMNLGGILLNALRGRPCTVFNSNLRVRIETTDLFTYPDLTVVCGSLMTSTADKNAVTNPLVIVEVLSPSSEVYDRGAKMDHYRCLPSLKEYVLVNHAREQIEIYRKNQAGRFEQFVFSASTAVSLVSIDVQFDVRDVYVDPLAAVGT